MASVRFSSPRSTACCACLAARRGPDHLQQPAQRAHLLERLHLLQEVLQREVVLLELLGHLLGLLLVGRLLGMGDVLTLVERAQETFDQKQAEQMAEKLKKNNFTLEDFLEQMQALKKMGPAGLACWRSSRAWRRTPPSRRQQADRPGRAEAHRGHHPLHDHPGATRPRTCSTPPAAGASRAAPGPRCRRSTGSSSSSPRCRR